jgi:hypothetical protein
MQEELIDEDVHFDSTIPQNLTFHTKRGSVKEKIELKNKSMEPLLEK